MTLLASTDAAALDVAPEAVLWRSYADAYQAGGFSYSYGNGWLLRSPAAGGATERVLLMPDSASDEASAFVVAGSDFYWTDSSGALWHADLGSGSTEAAVVEQRGSYDDDDYDGLLGTDVDAVYWQAGANPDLRTSDGEALALFRTCRPRAR